jgi:hypothetical protein
VRLHASVSKFTLWNSYIGGMFACQASRMSRTSWLRIPCVRRIL